MKGGPPGTEPDITIHARYMLVTEYSPGKFSVYDHGTREQMLAAHMAYLTERGKGARPQGLQLHETITVLHPLERIEGT